MVLQTSFDLGDRRNPTRRSAVRLLLSGFVAFGIAGCNDGGGGAAGTETAGGTDSAGTGGTDAGDTGVDDEIEPVPGGMRRLLAHEYIGSVEVMLGAEAATVAAPPEDQARQGFDAIGAEELSLSAEAVEVYERSATDIADAAIANKATLAQTAPCVETGGGQACYEEVARQLGRFAWRRDLEDVEVTGLVDLALEGQTWGDGDFDTGLKYEIMGILQSPNFLYIMEVGVPDPDLGFRRLEGQELASRLSFFILGHTPSLDLLDTAASGGLDTPEQIRAVAEQMVQSPGARTGRLQTFFDELFKLRDLEGLTKTPATFPLFSTDLAAAMRNETLLLVNDVVWAKNGDARTLFTADYTFVNDPLAELYGMTPPGTGEVFKQVTFPAEQSRRGFLSQASFLTSRSNPNRNSPTKRGKYVQEVVLCSPIPPPPPDVMAELPPIPDDTSLREALEIHMTDADCAACHGLTDPIGFAFEFYDAIGQYRTLDNGVPIDASGDVPGLGAWDDAAGLAEIVADDPRAMTCLIRNVIRGTLGHIDTPGETPAIEALDVAFAESGYSIQTLLVEMAASPVFRLVDEPK